MLKRLLGLKDRDSAGRELYGRAVEQARLPGFYRDLGVADRIDSRFELYTLHVLLLVMRLRDERTPQAAETAQELFDTYVSALDNTLRELGVGDVEVSKKMRRLGEALYGRMQAYEQALREEDIPALQAALARNVYADEQGRDPRARALARHVQASRVQLAVQSVASLLKQPDWLTPLSGKTP